LLIFEKLSVLFHIIVEIKLSLRIEPIIPLVYKLSI